MFLTFCALSGVVFSSIVFQYTQASIFSTLFVTGGAFFALSVYGTVTKRNLDAWRSFLFMGLIGIVLAGIVNIFLRSSGLEYRPLLRRGAGLRRSDGLRHAEVAAAGRDDGEQRHALIGALMLYLDFVNLFLFLSGSWAGGVTDNAPGRWDRARSSTSTGRWSPPTSSTPYAYYVFHRRNDLRHTQRTAARPGDGAHLRAQQPHEHGRSSRVFYPVLSRAISEDRLIELSQDPLRQGPQARVYPGGPGHHRRSPQGGLPKIVLCTGAIDITMRPSWSTWARTT